MRPRDLVLSHLAAVGEVTDPGGLASAVLSAAIGYRGTNTAFAQLLHEMERAGLVERDVRGKRTYRIALASAPSATGPVPAAGPASAAGAPAGAASPTGAVPGTGPVPVTGAGTVPPAGIDTLPAAGTGTVPAAGTVSAAGPVPAVGAVPNGSGPPRGDAGGGIDYDELARRLLAEVVRRIAAPGGSVPSDRGGSGDSAIPDNASISGNAAVTGDAVVSGGAVVPGVPADVSRTVARLERKLASAEERQRSLRTENARLRELLAEAKRDLREDEEAALLLERLLDSRLSDDPSWRSA